MPSLKDIQRRITAVKKTQQITRAMRMVAGAKLRRAQDTSERARPYAVRMQSTLAEVARGLPDDAHPLFEVRDPVEDVEVIVVSSDRGLCGAFNSNVTKFALAHIQDLEAKRHQPTITTAGRRANDFFKRRHPDKMGAHYPQAGWVSYEQAAEIARRVMGRFLSGEVDEVWLVYNEFLSAISQKPTAVRLLPFSASGDGEPVESLPHEIEPSPESLLAVLVPKAVEVAIYQALLENQTGEHAARMAAMESATRNTEELVETLTLQFNRARQAAITKELVEIVSGAEAL